MDTGQKVVCINDFYAREGLAEGEVYTVTKYSSDCFGVNGKPEWWSKKRFKPYVEVSMQSNNGDFFKATNDPEHPILDLTKVVDFNVIKKPTDKITSDGGSTDYYNIPEGSTTLNDIIEANHMSFARGNIFKAIYRLDKKQGVDVEYDLNKIIYFAERMREMHRKGIPL